MQKINKIMYQYFSIYLPSSCKKGGEKIKKYWYLMTKYLQAGGEKKYTL